MRRLTFAAPFEVPMPFPFLILGVIVLMAVLIAGYMYLQWAKVRDSAATRDRG